MTIKTWVWKKPHKNAVWGRKLFRGYGRPGKTTVPHRKPKKKKKELRRQPTEKIKKTKNLRHT